MGISSMSSHWVNNSEGDSLYLFAKEKRCFVRCVVVLSEMNLALALGCYAVALSFNSAGFSVSHCSKGTVFRRLERFCVFAW